MPIGIMAAMREEIDALLHHNMNVRWSKTRVGDRDFYSGTLHGVEVVAAFSRWGKVAAAATATHMIDRFAVSELWFTGVAGSLQPGVRIGDIVIADGLIQHDMDARPLFNRFEIPLSGRWRFETTEAVRGTLQSAATAFVQNGFDVAVTPEIRSRFGIGTPRVIVGDVATGDQFIASGSAVAALHSLLPECVCVEMEGAAVAQICHEHGLRFGVLRVISDSADHTAHVDFPKFVGEVASVYTDAIIGLALQAQQHAATDG